jgi:hypothetical protein
LSSRLNAITEGEKSFFRLRHRNRPFEFPASECCLSAGNYRVPGSQIEVFRKALADVGDTEDENILVEYR